jgi:hypothetical protein
MDLIEAANHLVKFGAILGIALGLLSLLYWAYIIMVGLMPPYFGINFYELFMMSISLVTIFLAYYVLTQFPQRIEVDPSRSALYLVGLGIIIAIGSWGLTGLLIVIGAVLILVDETS